MKKYHVAVTPEVKDDLKRYLSYVRNRLKNPQAAKSIAEDFRDTIKELTNVAGVLSEPDSSKLKERGLKRIYFKKHDYFLLYRIVGHEVEITNMFHMLEDYENKLR